MDKHNQPPANDPVDLLKEHYEAVEMRDGFRHDLLIQSRVVVAARRRQPIFRWAASLAGAAVAIAVLVLAGHSIFPIRTGQRSASVPRIVAPSTKGAAEGNPTPSIRQDAPSPKKTLPSVEHMAKAAPSTQPQQSPRPIGASLVAVISVQQPAIDGTGKALAAGDMLPAGDAIRTGRGGRVMLVTRRGSELHLDANSELVLSDNLVPTISRGRLYCSNRNKEIARIDTPAGRVRLLGTVVDTAVVRKDTVAVTVVEGKVRLSNQHGSAVVNAGNRSVLVAGYVPRSGVPVNTGKETSWYQGRGLASLQFADGALSAEENVVVIDPNVSGKITAMEYSQTDARLTQNVSYEARIKTVQQIVDDLREMSGVKLVSGARDSDWPVRNRKMNIFVKDVPLCELMDSIARVMQFRWSRNDDATPMTYRLKVIGKSAAEADAMMKRAEKTKEEMWRKRRQGWIDAIAKYGGKSASELTSLRETDPQIYEQALLGSLEAVYALFKEVPETKGHFAAGTNFRISGDQLSPETKRLFFSAGNEFWKHLQRGGYIGKKTQNPPGYDGVLNSDDDFDVAYRRLDVETFTPNLRWGSASVSDTGYWHLMKGGRDFEVNGFRYLGTEWNRHVAMGNIRINEGTEVDEVRTSEAEDRTKAFTARFEDSKKLEESLYPSEPLVEHTPFAELDQKITIKIEKPEPDENRMMSIAEKIASFQKALSETSGLGLVSDCWLNLRIYGNVSLPEKEANLSEFLETFSSALNYNWDKPGPILEFRHRKWAKMRLNQIPDEWVSRWSKDTKENGYLSLDDLAEISNITYDQAEESAKPDPVMGAVYWGITANLDDNLTWVRLYGSLKPQQRELLATEHGLSAAMLTPEQWKLALPMFDRIGIERGDAAMRIVPLINRKKKRYRYYFHEIDVDSGKTDRTWDVELPTYTPPPPSTEAGGSK